MSCDSSAKKEEAAEEINNARAQAATKAKLEKKPQQKTNQSSIMAKLTRGSPLPWAWLSPEASWATHLIIDNLSLISEQEEEQNNRKPFKTANVAQFSKKKQKFALPSLSLCQFYIVIVIWAHFSTVPRNAGRGGHKRNCSTVSRFVYLSLLLFYFGFCL